MTPTLGRFLELSVPADDIPASLDFYSRLGFSELSVNDVRHRPYAVVTDGALIIGLHGAGLEEPALAFVQPNLAHDVPGLAGAGVELVSSRLGEESFNEAVLIVHDDVRLLLVEARTYSSAGIGEMSTPPMGTCDEICIGCSSVAHAAVGWARLGPTVTDANEDRVRLAAGDVSLVLRESPFSVQPLLRYETSQLDTLAEILEARDVRAKRGADGAIVTAPEGTVIHLVERK